MVISRINATKTMHLEQEKNILTLVGTGRNVFLQVTFYTHANNLCTGLVEPSQAS